jgi:hypothetical protein
MGVYESNLVKASHNRGSAVKIPDQEVLKDFEIVFKKAR